MDKCLVCGEPLKKVFEKSSFFFKVDGKYVCLVCGACFEEDGTYNEELSGFTTKQGGLA